MDQSLVVFNDDKILCRGKEYEAVSATIELSEDLMAGGLMEGKGLKSTVRKVPGLKFSIGDYVVYRGERFKVELIADDLISFDLTCSSDRK